MSLRDLKLKFYYDNDNDDLINDFYMPIISESKKYKRSTGFFSSSSFWNIIDGLKVFIENDGKIQIMVSPNLSEEDIEAINLGEKAKEDTIESFIMANFLDTEKYHDQFNLLAWLIYQNKLEIKIVVKKDVDKFGIFHDKSAIMVDSDGNKIAYHGSLNESLTAYSHNFEAVNVFVSWNNSDCERIRMIEQSFDRIWNNNSINWQSYSIPDSIKEKIIKKRTLIVSNRFDKKFNIPENFKLRHYQEEAINKWMEHGFSGILEMATGSGKTFTAIFALNRLMAMIEKKGFTCGILIVVPYKNLLEQWCVELDRFNVEPIKCYKDKYKWYYELKNSVKDFNNGTLKSLYVITTNSTFITDHFQEIIKDIKRDYIFCADEMHHLSAPKISKVLPENTNFRLGLTATLFNEYEEEKAEKVLRYFKKVVYKFSMKDAINNDCLTRYYYYPIFIELTNEERQFYRELTKKISRMMFTCNEDDQKLKVLINQRRRIILNAENKISEFLKMKDIISKYNKTLVYCGDKIDEEGKFINKINRMIYDMGITTHTYSSELDDKTKQMVLKNFEKGKFNILTAIKCLDEGIDIPSLECAFILASNMDSKQFIQRRGRILRKAKNKKYAFIYDFVVVPTLNQNLINSLNFDELKVERKIFGNELKRVYEFAELCENKSDVLFKIIEVLKLYKQED